MDNNDIILNYKSNKSKISFCNYLDAIYKIVSNRQFVILCDKNVYSLYSDIQKFEHVFLIDSIEENKNLKTVETIYNWLNEIGIDKHSVIIGIGGGIVCDITGFVASTYYRGLSFALIPTTLLSMIDASIGGKNGVNFNNHKNIIGNITQPSNIVIDSNFIKTLDSNEIECGMGEAIKHAIISGNTLFQKLNNKEQATSIKNKIISSQLIKEIISVKSSIVLEDEFENNKRQILNLGHTIGHVIETSENINHGKAVGLGILLAAKISAKLNITNNDIVSTVKNILLLYNLPVSTNISIDTICENIIHDKKKNNNHINFILIKDIGKVEIHQLGIAELSSILKTIDINES